MERANSPRRRPSRFGNPRGRIVAAMLPISTRRIFRSRWWALAWAAGVCWTAVDIADGNSGPAPSDANAANAAGDDDGNVAAAAAALNGVF